jgi:hypothetical protein
MFLNVVQFGFLKTGQDKGTFQEMFVSVIMMTSQIEPKKMESHRHDVTNHSFSRRGQYQIYFISIVRAR